MLEELQLTLIKKQLLLLATRRQQQEHNISTQYLQRTKSKSKCNHNRLRNGPLLSDFKSVSVAVLVPYLGVINSQMIKVLERIENEGNTCLCTRKFNSIHKTLKPLKGLGIPITLIHEFSAYIRPESILENVGIWSNNIL